MKVMVAGITVQELDQQDIDGEYDERMEIQDDPEGDQCDYYAHEGHRVFLTTVDEAGEHVDLDVTVDNLAALMPIQPEVNAALVGAGAETAEIGWTFSAYAGCGTCACSPGFLVRGTGPFRQAFVTVTVLAETAAA